KDINKERGDGTTTGRYLVKQVIGPLSAAIKKFVEEAYAGRPGPRAVAARLIKDMDPAVVAFLATRAMISRLLYKPNVPMVGLARLIGNTVETEARFNEFAAKAPSLYATIDRQQTKTGATTRHKKVVLGYAMSKYEIGWDGWSKTDCIHLGLKLIELCQESSGIIEFSEQQVTFSGAYKSQYLVNFTPKVDEWVKQSLIRGADFHPLYLPTIIPPKPWTSLQGGGYYSTAVKPLRLVRGMRKEHRRLLEGADLSVVFAGVNAIQSTPWQINAPILNVMQQLAKTNSEIAGMVSKDDLKLPDKPHDIDTNEEALRQWKWAARDVYMANVKLRNDRLRQEQLLDLADRFKDEQAIYFPHTLDFRGRAYPVPQMLNPQGSDQVKALLRFAEGKPLGKEGMYWLAVHGANCFGVDKVPFEERVAWVKDHEDLITSAAVDPLGCLWWTEADSPWCFLAFCFEWNDVICDGGEHISHLPVALDGSCNGLQHFSAMLRDPVGGAAVNLLPSEKPQDIYKSVADVVLGKLKRFTLNGGTEEADAGEAEKKARWAYAWRHFGIDRKVTKRSVMVLPYGGTARSCLKYVEEAVREKIASGSQHNLGEELSPAIAWLASLVWESIGDVVVAAREAMDWLQKTARTVAKENKPLSWEAPSGFIVYQAIYDLKLRRIKTLIAGLLLYFGTYQETPKINGNKQATSLSPNFVHSMDASAMMLTVARMRAQGFRHFAMIHDSYAVHACDTPELARVLREEFVEMYRNNPLASFKARLEETLDNPDKLEELPTSGSLHIEEVLKSDFFFA
ncbi:DNA-directed RNA polymerase, partial [Brucella sp. 10RB9210]|uniref:DNA-directed RNA polymerase n=1 Tax=Brucella sp. 10RB9210 TaxID=1844037 RepID=UPI0012AD803A